MCSVCLPKGCSRRVTVLTLGPQIVHRACKHNTSDGMYLLQIAQLTDKI